MAAYFTRLYLFHGMSRITYGKPRPQYSRAIFIVRNITADIRKATAIPRLCSFYRMSRLTYGKLRRQYSKALSIYGITPLTYGEPRLVLLIGFIRRNLTAAYFTRLYLFHGMSRLTYGKTRSQYSRVLFIVRNSTADIGNATAIPRLCSFYGIARLTYGKTRRKYWLSLFDGISRLHLLLDFIYSTECHGLYTESHGPSIPGLYLLYGIFRLTYGKPRRKYWLVLFDGITRLHILLDFIYCTECHGLHTENHGPSIPGFYLLYGIVRLIYGKPRRKYWLVLFDGISRLHILLDYLFHGMSRLT